MSLGWQPSYIPS